MTDSMKFGPEWLRNLSAEGNTTSSSSGGSRYYLADHRYGREEMLALFDQSLKLRPPSSIENFPTLFISQPLHPLALAPMTEDETRLWTGRSAPQGAPRGRGGSMDRGRGRGRGGTFHPGFTRSSSTYDEPLRPFDRTQSDRSWSERNGDLGEWGVSTSPRKEYGSNRGASNNSDNWRKHRTEDCDTDGWRSSNHRATSLQEKWSGSSGRSISSNWRDGDSRDDHGHLGDRPGPTSSRVTWHSGSDVSRGPPHRRPWDMEDHLPEWATENPSESGGTFDASGAFHGSDDETPPEKSAFSSRTSRETSSSLQKSASQHNIQSAKKPTPLSTSQSATNLMKKAEEPSKEINNSKEKVEEKPPVIKETKKKEEERITKAELKESKPDVQPSLPAKKDDPREPTSDPNNMQICKIEMIKDSHSSTSDSSSNKVDDEFDHMKEVTDDIVAKLILDDEPMKAVTTTTGEPQRSVGGGGAVAPLSYTAGLQSVLGNAPPSSMPPPPGTGQDKWYYRDPQGEVQGPFTSQEMAEWFRAGYFTISLFVRRQCDERYFTLGELVKQCPGVPFLNCRLPPLKAQADPMTMALGKVSAEIGDPALLQRTLHMHLLRQAEAIRTLSETEPWGSLSHLQQRELVTQHIMAQPPVLTEMPYVAPLPNTQITNPLLHMLSQMQQANKLPGQPSIVEKPPNSIPTQHLDPLQQLVQQMGGLQTNMGPTITNMVPTQPPASAASNTPQLDPNSQQPDDAIKSLLRQLANQSEQRDIWDVRRSQAPPPFPAQPAQPWMGNVAPAAGIPHSMWDLHIQNTMPVIPPPIVTPTSIAMNPQAQITAAPPNITGIPSIINQPITNHQPSPPVTTATPPALPTTLSEPQLNNTISTSTIEHKDHEKEQKKKAEQEKEQKQKERKEATEKEKRRKEQEQQEKLKAQREAEEKRKEEQKKKEAEKKAEAERQKKEAERARKEMEKAKREAEEKKARELEEKKKLKEQKKAVEEAKKKAEEERKKEEEEKQRKDAERREEQSRRQAEALKKMQEQQQQQRTKVAPWCQAAVAAATTNNTSLSLAEIQRAEREKRAEQTALLLQQQKLAAAKEQEQQAQEKSSLNLKWAKKPALPKKVKPLAEIQAEEQERAARQAAEARLAQQQKERELPPQPAAHTSIWSTASQSLTWVTNTHTTGFWDDSPAVQKMPNKSTPAALKNNSNNQATQQQNNTNNKANAKTNNKSKAKKEEQQAMKLFEKNGPTTDEFTSWCINTLSTLKGEVDVPTFVAFLRDVESPYDVKDYVRQYYGDTTQAMHFANQFVERRCKVNDQQRAAMQYKDDLCQPAPAITPSTEFQEVKGKGKKTKKSKMMKVDSRCLGFSVTAAEDRINVGDRDYGDSI